MKKDLAKTLFEVTPKIKQLADLCEKNNAIDRELYTQYDVKRGLRDLNGKGTEKACLQVLPIFPTFARRKSSMVKKFLAPAVCITEVITSKTLYPVS